MTLPDFLLEVSRVAIGLGLAVWIGGTALAGIAAPKIFRALPSRAKAGELFGEILDTLDRLKFVMAGFLLVAVLLEVQVLGSALPTRHVVRAAVLFVLIASHVYAVMVVRPKMRYYREKVRSFDEEGADDPWRAKFGKEHRKSELVAKIGLLLAVLALILG